MEHGVTAYRRGCRCEVCRTARREYVRLYRAGKRRRTWALPAQEHIEKLTEAGYSYGAIAELSGVAIRTIRRIRDGYYKKVSQQTMDAVLGVTLDSMPQRALVPRQIIEPLTEAVEGVLGRNGVRLALRHKWYGPLVKGNRMTPRRAQQIAVLGLALQRRGLIDGTLITGG